MKKKSDIEYINKYTLKSKILYANSFIDSFICNLKKEWELIYIDIPLTAHVTDSFFCNDFIQRKIEFDSIGVDLFYFIVTDYSIWIRNKIIQLDLKPNQGLYSIHKKIKRDAELYNSSIEQRNFHIELVVLEGDDNDEIINITANKIMTIISKVISEITIFNDLIKKEEIINRKNFFKNYVTKDFLLSSKFYPFFNQKNFIDDFISKNNFCLINNIYKDFKKNLFFNDFYLYGINLKKFSKFFFYNDFDKKKYNLFDISIRPKLDEIYFFIDELKIKKNILSKEVIDVINNSPKTLSFDLNLDVLFLLIFCENF